jgi:hypothetical protein
MKKYCEVHYNIVKTLQLYKNISMITAKVLRTSITFRGGGVIKTLQTIQNISIITAKGPIRVNQKT